MSIVSDPRTRLSWQEERCVGQTSRHVASTECRGMAAAWLLWPTVQASANGCVFVSNDHGDALEEWLRATADAERPLAVFHIDAHNDLTLTLEP